MPAHITLSSMTESMDTRKPTVEPAVLAVPTVVHASFFLVMVPHATPPSFSVSLGVADPELSPQRHDRKAVGVCEGQRGVTDGNQ